jgi:hypothetical protein
MEAANCSDMLTEDQAEAIAFLSSPAAHGGETVERIDTHAAVVVLAGSLAWKLKRAVRFDYLDFSTAAKRKAACEAELAINQRTAATLYRRVVPITRSQDGRLALGGVGEPVDWVLEMRRFDQDLLFDRLAARGALDVALADHLAAAIAELHLAADVRPDHGGAAGMAWVIDGNAAGFAEQGSGILDPVACDRLTAAARAALDRHGPLLESRRLGGFVRQCHGDLHLRNIVLLDGAPTPFDAVEFNDRIACIDVMYDLAFLLMDLWRRGLPRHANAVLNGYLRRTADDAGLRALPLFLACRAAVRAKTSATAAAMQDRAEARRELDQLAREYLAMGVALLDPPAPTLVAVGGLSGSGKSTLAAAVAPLIGAVPGAVVLRSDEIRKALFSVPRLEPLGPEGYTAEASARVYAELVRRAGEIVRAGHSVVVDAVFARAEDRAAVEAAAASAGVPWVGFWLEAPEPARAARARARRLDPSDAGAAVIAKQAATLTGALSWHRLDAGSGAEATEAQALAALRSQLSAALTARPSPVTGAAGHPAGYRPPDRP